MDNLIIIRPLRWYDRVWHRVLLRLGKEPLVHKRVGRGPMGWTEEYENLYLCCKCKKYVSWDSGCADRPECDDCWALTADKGRG